MDRLESTELLLNAYFAARWLGETPATAKRQDQPDGVGVTDGPAVGGGTVPAVDSVTWP